VFKERELVKTKRVEEWYSGVGNQPAIINEGSL
jgi:hypothetical protein